MPKSLDKTGGRKRKITTNEPNNNTGSEESETSCTKKKKGPPKRALLEGVEISRNLAAKMKERRITRSSGSDGRTTKNSGPRVCGNGKPMPSLAELEAMYRDSDDDGEPTQERCAMPEKPRFEVNDEDLNSPSALQKIASKAVDILSKTLENTFDGPPPPVIPPKKRKRPEVPYIVGCKERDQVPWAPKTKWCVGSEEYGVESNSDDDEEIPTKRKKRGKKINLSKSIFNAQSDEIAERLKEAELVQAVRGGSPDSNDTVEYDYPSVSPNMSIPRAFSPLPSTSRDCETIFKNDKMFNESLQCEHSSNDSQNDVEVVEVPCETIIIDDSITLNTKRENSWEFEDDSCIIVEPKRNRNCSVAKNTSPRHDAHSSIDLTHTYDDEVYEICDDDIENVIAENQAILGKSTKKNNINSVTAVDASVIFVSETSRPELTTTLHNVTDVISVQSSANVHNQTNIASHPMPEVNSGNNVVLIQEVVNDYFNQPQPTSIPRTDTVDLTSCQERFRSTFSNLFSSIESIFRVNSRTNFNANPDIVNQENIIPSTVNQRTNIEIAPIQNNISATVSPQSRNIPTTPDNSYTAMPPLTNVDPRHKNNNQIVNTAASAQNQMPQFNDTPPRPPGISLGDCPICMEPLENKQVASTLCGHVFCMKCIKAAIKSNGNYGKRCPTCRKVLKGVGYHQLFLS